MIALSITIIGLAVNPPQAVEINTPHQYISNLTPPQFSAGHTMPHLTRCGWAMSISTNLLKILADDWGYALDVDLSNSTVQRLTTEPYGMLAISLASNNPAKYKLSSMINRVFPSPIPDTFWCRDENGWFVDIQSNHWQYATNTTYHKVQSPEAPYDYLQLAASNQVSSLVELSYYAPVSIILNTGETGLGVFAGDGQAWRIDPVVTNALGSQEWPTYGSQKKAIELGCILNELNVHFPAREFYLYYNTGSEGTRTGPSWKAWWGYYSDVMVTNTDYPSFESYYAPYNGQQWTGDWDQLTRFLNSVGYNINLGKKLYYDWVCGGWWNEATNRSTLPLYSGFLKCCYTGGMIGANAGYYRIPIEGGFDVSFPVTDPPGWLLQIVALSRVHAMFSHLENYIRIGDLLPGPNMHKYSTDQPAYEFPTGFTDTRVLCRKLTASNNWLITAWAADGTNRTVNVTIPTLGTVTVTAIDSANVYHATTTNLVLLNDNGLEP